MMLDNHYKTIDDVEKSTNHTIAGLLPGYIKRHREEIIAAVHRAAWCYERHHRMQRVAGANAVLNILSEGLVGGAEEES